MFRITESVFDGQDIYDEELGIFSSEVVGRFRKAMNKHGYKEIREDVFSRSFPEPEYSHHGNYIYTYTITACQEGNINDLFTGIKKGAKL